MTAAMRFRSSEKERHRSDKDRVSVSNDAPGRWVAAAAPGPLRTVLVEGVHVVEQDPGELDKSRAHGARLACGLARAGRRLERFHRLPAPAQAKRARICFRHR